MGLTRLALVLVFLVIRLNTSAQNKIEESTVRVEPAQSRKASNIRLAAKPVKLTPQQKRAVQLLSAARAEAAGLEPDMRAFVLWKVARGLEAVDAEKSQAVLKEAFLASQSVEEKQAESDCGMDEVCHVKRFLQFGILHEIALRAPEAEDLLPRAEPDVRDQITSSLISEYTHKKDLSRAEALLQHQSDAKYYPYSAACDLMAALPASSPQRLSIFLQAVHNFRQQKSGRLVSLTDDLGEMVDRFWQTLPAAAVLDAIDVLLESAKDRDQGQRMQVSFSARGGKSGSFSSAYQLRLFQVLPVLEQLDKSRAEGLLKENESMRAMLTQYPQGVLSLNPKASHQGGDFGIYTSSIPWKTLLPRRRPARLGNNFMRKSSGAQT